jgi:hypothetical protein
MSDPRKEDVKAPGHFGNQRPKQDGGQPSGQDRQEQHQQSKDQARIGDAGQIGNPPAKPDLDNDLGRGTPGDREDRIRQRAYEIWEREGRPDGQAKEHWDRAGEDLDREKDWR